MKPFLPNLPASLNEQRKLTAEVFDRTLDTLPRSQPASSPGSAETGPFPFDVELVAAALGTSDASIRPGTINGLVPTDILDVTNLDDTLSYYLVLSVVAADGQIASASIAFTTTPPSPIPATLGAPPLAFDYTIGMVVLGTWIRTIGNGSLFASVSQAFQVDKTAPAPGTLPYEIWMTWALEQA
jgi:hypothetical protein